MSLSLRRHSGTLAQPKIPDRLKGSLRCAEAKDMSDVEDRRGYVIKANNQDESQSVKAVSDISHTCSGYRMPPLVLRNTPAARPMTVTSPATRQKATVSDDAAAIPPMIPGATSPLA
jgi:hypothetical protein